MTRRHDLVLLAGIVFLGLLARLLVAAVLGGGFHFADETLYVDAARGLLRTGGFDPSYARVPGYPVLLAFLGLPAPDSVLWLRVAQVLFTTAGVGLTFLVGDRLVGRRAGLAAAGLYALDPLVAVSAALLYPEASAAVVLTAAALITVEAARRDSIALSAAVGLLLGILVLSRPAGLAVVPVAAVWIAWTAPSTPLRRVAHAGLVVLLCLLLLAPWTYRNYQIHGRIIVVSEVGTKFAGPTKAHGVAGALVVSATRNPMAFVRRTAVEFAYFWELVPQRLKTDDAETRQALHHRNPRLPTTPMAPRSLRDLVAGTASGIELLLALTGLVVVWRSRRREAVLLTGMILIFALGHSLFLGKMRYRITVLPLVFVLAGAGFVTLQAAVARHLSRRQVPPMG